ncbi:Protein N-acetyltransferase, RimJ/RimL family [Halopenitus malekzadehii]|uniref:Protein N-acetyltransferase, RimJ/RimL family n=1 Tax=Halopenitus malekzadehii TaxID=1267564 RepID=A0A1H6IRY2_9EURY|nr:GNAT family protein [Halopenitus malekzadehii]SEH49401.1 Protein N-acetyltransferase, RimJ/RimL family [Halopenitus malekzadehii]
MFPELIETDRLRLTPLWPDRVDVHELYRICSSDPGIETVTEYVTWDPHDTIDETAAFLDRGRSTWEQRSAVNYLIRPAEGEEGAGEIAGCTELRIDWDRRLAEPGIWLRDRFQGSGYAGERAAALLELAFDRLDLAVVAVSHHPDNDRSQRAIERYVDRFGGRREGRLRNDLTFLDGSVHDRVRYTISRSEWRTATDGGTDIL